MQPLPCTQHQTCGHCHATNITKLKHVAVAVHTVPNMQVLLLNQYHSAKARHCCHSIQPISLAQSMQLFPCTQYQTCSCCHATNIAQLKHATVAMHTIPIMNCCYATNITQLKHTAIAMYTKPSMHLLLCTQCHSG